MLVPTLKTDRLRIRTLTVNDLSVVHRRFLDTRWAGQGLTDERNLQIRRNWLDWTIRNYKELDRLDQLPYGDRAVELGENGRSYRIGRPGAFARSVRAVANFWQSDGRAFLGRGGTLFDDQPGDAGSGIRDGSGALSSVLLSTF